MSMTPAPELAHQQCDSCRSAPCAFYCRADAASLCAACDADVHSANPLARRHRRVPVAVASPPHPSASAAFVVRPGGLNAGSSWPFADGGSTNKSEADDCKDEADEEEASSWLLMRPFGDADDVDAFLDLGVAVGGDYDHKREADAGAELVVPGEQQPSFHVEMLFDTSRNPYGSYSLSMSSMEASGGDQDCAAMDVTSACLRPSKSTIELFSVAPTPSPAVQLVGVDREARLLRYREKRKMRRFEKTIRYASRKAYAETRPRIKGRFAKRSDVDLEVDQYLSAAALTAVDSGYGIVPTF